MYWNATMIEVTVANATKETPGILASTKKNDINPDSRSKLYAMYANKLKHGQEHFFATKYDAIAPKTMERLEINVK